MKLMQRILSRSLLIILILVAGIAYYYRDQLFPTQEKERVAVSDDSGEPAASGDQEKSEASHQAGTDNEQVEVSPGAASAPPDTEAESSPPQPGELASVQPPPMQPESMEDNTPPEMNQPETSSPTMPDDVADNRQSQPVEKPAQEQSGQTQPDSGQGVSLEDARSAYWTGDRARAEKLYRTIMQANTESPEAAGELGNMLYSNGDFEGAAEAYYQAAIRLERQGADMQARHLARIIRGLDSSKAEALEEELNQ